MQLAPSKARCLFPSDVEDGNNAANRVARTWFNNVQPYCFSPICWDGVAIRFLALVFLAVRSIIHQCQIPSYRNAILRGESIFTFAHISRSPDSMFNFRGGCMLEVFLVWLLYLSSANYTKDNYATQDALNEPRPYVNLLWSTTMCNTHAMGRPSQFICSEPKHLVCGSSVSAALTSGVGLLQLTSITPSPLALQT